MESCYKNMSKIRNITYIFQRFEKNKNIKIFFLIPMVSEKSMNLFEIEKNGLPTL